MNGLAGVHAQQTGDALRRTLTAVVTEVVQSLGLQVEGGEPSTVEYQSKQGSGTWHGVTYQEAAQLKDLGQPLRMRRVTDWVEVPR